MRSEHRSAESECLEPHITATQLSWNQSYWQRNHARSVGRRLHRYTHVYSTFERSLWNCLREFPRAFRGDGLPGRSRRRFEARIGGNRLDVPSETRDRVTPIIGPCRAQRNRLRYRPELLSIRLAVCSFFILTFRAICVVLVDSVCNSVRKGIAGQRREPTDS